MALLGLLTRQATLVTLAGAGFVGLAAALAATLPLGRRVRRQRLEFAWWLGHGQPGTGPAAVVPGAPFEVRCYVRHRGETPLHLEDLRPLVAEGARLLEPEPRPLDVHARARTEFAFELCAEGAGRVVLHGLAVRLQGPFGLFAVPLYFPNPLSIRVLPRAAAHAGATFRVTSDLPVERSGRATLRRRGGGTDLYELRELQPGDPYKSIAWKASARLGKLVIREVEREVQESRFVVIDVSGTMRGGIPGRRKLDLAIDVAAFEARRALRAGDLVGLATVDERLLSWVPARDDATHVLRIYDALLAATEVVDEDLTAIDRDGLVDLVGRYVRNQDGVDFARRGGDPPWDLRGLVKHVRASLDAAEADAGSEPVASTPEEALLRRFCRARGIPILHRPEPRNGAKAHALADTLRRVGESGRGAQDVLVVTDFDGIADLSPVVAGVRLLRRRGSHVRFLLPDGRRLAPAPRDGYEAALREVFTLTEERRVREARAALGRLGVAVRLAAPGAPPPRRGLAA